MAEAARRGTGGGSRRWLAAWLVFAGICVAAVLYFALVFVPGERAAAIEVWRGRLTAMADDRKVAIAAWLDERRGRCHESWPSTPPSPHCSPARTRFSAPYRPRICRSISLQGFLDSVRAAYGYSGVYVVDATGQVRAGSTASSPLAADCLSRERARPAVRPCGG